MSQTRQWRRFVLFTRTRWVRRIFHTSGPHPKLRNMCRQAGNAIV
jgi:hypothetical protein